MVDLCDVGHGEFDPGSADSNFGDPDGFFDVWVAFLEVIDALFDLADGGFAVFEGEIAGEGVGVYSINVDVIVDAQVEEFLEVSPWDVGGEEVDVVATEAT